MQPEYVFIVGLPRTGSKLMMNILENAQDKSCHIIPENFFLGRFLQPGVRQKIKKIGDMSLEANVHRLVDDMFTGKFFGAYWVELAKGQMGLDRESMLQRILQSDRSDKEIYSILLQTNIEINDQTILGDKTGPHLYHVPTLLAWFPEAKIIHTFRDPRAVLVSEHKKLLGHRRRRVAKLREGGQKWRAGFLALTEPALSVIIVLYVTVAWLYAVKLHSRYKKRYPQNYHLSKFEDLVSAPEENVGKICQFVGLEFHPAMLNPPRVGSSYTRQEEAGFDKQTLVRWQNDLKPWMTVGLWLWGRKYLREFGYI